MTVTIFRHRVLASLAATVMALGLSLPGIAQGQGATSDLAIKGESKIAPETTPTPTPPSAESRLKGLEERIGRLELEREGTVKREELTELQLELLIPPPLTRSFTGLGPGASKVYGSEEPLSVGAFGEVTFTSPEGGNRSTNLVLVNPYLGFRFSRTIIFNSSLSFQNGGAVTGTDMSLKPAATRIEFAYLDFLFGEETGLRVGNFLIPFGNLNLRHEPNLFPTVRRYETEQVIVPTTWHENGLMAFWRADKFLVQLGAVNSTLAERYEGATWIRAGRQNGADARATDLAFFTQLEIVHDGVRAGASYYEGQSGQGKPSLGEARVSLAALHAHWNSNRFEGQAMLTFGRLSDAARVSAASGQAIASRARGAYLALGYDVLPRVGPIASQIAKTIAGHPTVAPGERSLPVFVSYELVDPQEELPSGMSRDPGTKASIFTFGANYRPHPQVVIKAAYRDREPEGRSAERSLEAGIGFTF
jgi:hypothetical protein